MNYYKLLWIWPNFHSRRGIRKFPLFLKILFDVIRSIWTTEGGSVAVAFNSQFLLRKYLESWLDPRSRNRSRISEIESWSNLEGDQGNLFWNHVEIIPQKLKKTVLILAGIPFLFQMTSWIGVLRRLDLWSSAVCCITLDLRQSFQLTFQRE